ncbi:MAG: C1 family peptidase [Thermodesulfobacteriota bacterium]
MNKGGVALAVLTVGLLFFSAYTPVSADETARVKIDASDGASGDRFGRAVAVSGSYAVIGACLADAAGKNSGAAYMFRQTGGGWSQTAKLIPRDALPHDYFGSSVAVSGSTALIGAMNRFEGKFGKGAVYLFQNIDSGWTQQGKWTPSDGAGNDNFGCSVAVSGEYALVGAFRHSARGTDAGAAYIFRNSGGSWYQQAKLTASDATAGDNFGRSVAIDGDYAVVGAIHENTRGTGAGAAYIFRNSGGNWTQHSKLLAADGSAHDFFGFSVSINGDYAVIGASGVGKGMGAAYVFQNTGGTWTQQAKLTAGDGMAGDFFGRSVSVSGDYLVAGADAGSASGGKTGVAYLFRKTSSGWLRESKILAGDGSSSDRFGWAAAISSPAPGDYVALIGSPGDDDRGNESGAAYFTGGATVPDIEIIPSELTIHQAMPPNADLDPSIPPPTRGDETYAPDAYGTGLIIPQAVKDYWSSNIPPPRKPGRESIPSSKDWSVYDSPVKSQGGCGACSVFSAVALVENLANQMNIPMYQDLSEQALLSCSGDISCAGGWHWDALNFISIYGIPSEACYPYQTSNGSCEARCDNPAFVEKITHFTPAPGLWGENHSVDDLRYALQNGPLTVAMRVPDDGTFVGSGYQGGIYNYTGGSDISWDRNGHSVLLVGYDDTQQYFKAKNSWGPDWGENGYFRIAYDDVTDEVKFGSYACTASGVYLHGQISTYTIVNRGSANLVIHDMRPSQTWMEISPAAPFTIAPNQKQLVTVTVRDWDWLSPVIDVGSIAVSSNDPDSPVVTVEIMAQRASLGEEEVEPGDIDRNPGVTLEDAIVSLQVLSGVSGVENLIRDHYDTSGADVNGNGRVGLEETIYILEKITGLSTR